MQRFYQLFLQVIYTLHYCHSLGGSVGASYNCHFVLLSPPLVANAQLAIWMSAAAPSTGLRIKDKKLWEKSIFAYSHSCNSMEGMKPSSMYDLCICVILADLYNRCEVSL